MGARSIFSHRLSRIPFSGLGLRNFSIHDQCVVVVHQHMASVARLRWMGVRLARQQGVGISAGAESLVAQLDVSEVAFGTLRAILGLTETLARPRQGLRVAAVDRPGHRCARVSVLSQRLCSQISGTGH